MCPFVRRKELNIPKHVEGDLYKILHVQGQMFPLYYGYYEDCERNNPCAEPMPIYPDFVKTPCYSAAGDPFVTKMQDACRHYNGVNCEYQECGECTWYQQGEELLGVCICPENRQEKGGQRYDG